MLRPSRTSSVPCSGGKAEQPGVGDLEVPLGRNLHVALLSFSVPRPVDSLKVLDASHTSPNKLECPRSYSR